MLLVDCNRARLVDDVVSEATNSEAEVDIFEVGRGESGVEPVQPLEEVPSDQQARGRAVVDIPDVVVWSECRVISAPIRVYAGIVPNDAPRLLKPPVWPDKLAPTAPARGIDSAVLTSECTQPAVK